MLLVRVLMIGRLRDYDVLTVLFRKRDGFALSVSARVMLVMERSSFEFGGISTSKVGLTASSVALSLTAICLAFVGASRTRKKTACPQRHECVSTDDVFCLVPPATFLTCSASRNASAPRHLLTARNVPCGLIQRLLRVLQQRRVTLKTISSCLHSPKASARRLRPSSTRARLW